MLSKEELGTTLGYDEIDGYAKAYAKRDGLNLPLLIAGVLATVLACGLGFLVDALVSTAELWFLSIIFALVTLCVMVAVMIVSKQNDSKVQSEIIAKIPNEDLEVYTIFVRRALKIIDDEGVKAELDEIKARKEKIRSYKEEKKCADEYSSILDDIVKSMDERYQNAEPDKDPYTYLVDSKGNVIAKCMQK